MIAKIKKLLNSMLIVSALNVSCLIFMGISPFAIKDVSMLYYLVFISFLYTFLVISFTARIWMLISEKKDLGK